MWPVKRKSQTCFAQLCSDLTLLTGYSGSSGQQDSVLLCGEVSLSHAAILILHIFGFLSYLLPPVEKVPEFHKIVHTKR